MKGLSKAAWHRRALLRMARDTEDKRGVFVANPEDKQAARTLERQGLLTIERTPERCSGLQVWYVRLVDGGIDMLEEQPEFDVQGRL